MFCQYQINHMPYTQKHYHDYKQNKMNNKILISYGTSITEARREAEQNYRKCKSEGGILPDHAKVGFLNEHLVSVTYEDFSTGTPLWGYMITHPNGAKTYQHKYTTIQGALEGAENYYNNHILPEIISKMKKVEDTFKIAIVGNAGTGLQALSHIVHNSLEGLKFKDISYKEPVLASDADKSNFSKEIANFLRSTPKIEIVELPQLKEEKNSLYGEFNANQADELVNIKKLPYESYQQPVSGENCLDAEGAVKAYTSPEYRAKIGRIGTDQPVLDHSLPSSPLNREKVNFVTKESIDKKYARSNKLEFGMFNITVKGYLDSSNDSPIVEYLADVVPSKGDMINVGEKRYKVIEREFNVMQSHKVILTVTKS